MATGKKSDGGKGSSARPFSIDHSTYSSNWDRIFKNRATENDDQQKSTTEQHSDSKNQNA